MARNLALRYLLDTYGMARLEGSIIGFPDDDALVHVEGLRKVEGHFSTSRGILYGRFVDPVSMTLSSARAELPSGADVRSVFALVNSNALFMDGASLVKLNGFDARFGVGAAYASGEDVDIVLRASELGIPIAATRDILAAHPVKPERLDRYFPGSVALLSAHWQRTKRSVFGAMLLRRLVSGLQLAAKGRISWRSLLRSFRWSLVLLSGRGSRPATAVLRDNSPAAMFGRELLAWHATGRKPARVVTWFNHHTARVSLQCAEVELEAFSHIGIDGSLLQLLLRSRVARTSADLVLPHVLPRLRGARIAVIGGSQAGVRRRAEAVQNLLAGGSQVVLAVDGYAGMRSRAPLVDQVAEANVDVVLIGAGAPLQDVVARALARVETASVILTCGGYMDQLVHGRYFPRWAHDMRLGWLIRIVREPRRLWRRYTIGALLAPRAAWLLRGRLRAASFGEEYVAFVRRGPSGEGRPRRDSHG